MEITLELDLPEDDVAFLDAYAVSHGLASRSAALQVAVDLLRARMARTQDVRGTETATGALADDPADQAEILAIQRFMGVAE
ncbi:hypothetical protein [Streptomyces sp. NPDC102360]|uniref:hypothetical protein n=1 Tax=Streptomyces sp. NPDC102360 TaxID=3366160 RepID=UPI0037FB7BE9